MRTLIGLLCGLAFVMAGAVAVTFIGYRLVQTQPHPVFAETFQMPAARDIDRPLIAGAACFGLGWGLGGYCLGPAVTALALGANGTLVFAACMLIGMWGARFAKNRPGGSSAQSRLA